MRFLSVTCIAVCLSVVSIVVSTAVVIGVSSAFAETATNSLGRRLSATVVKSTNDRVRELLDLAVNHEAGLRFGFYSGAYPNIHLNQSREAVLPFLRTMSPSIEESALRLLYIGAGFEDDSSFYSKVITTLHFVNRVFIGMDAGVTTYDPTTRGWYAGVRGSTNKTLPMAALGAATTLASESVRITSPFPSNDFANFIVHVNGPLYNQSRHFIGVSAVALDLRFLSVFLREVRPATSSGSVSFMVDNSGLLMATSIVPEGGTSDIAQVRSTFSAEEIQRDFNTYAIFNQTVVIPTNIFRGCANVNVSVNAIDTPVTVCRHSPSTFPDTLIRSLAGSSAVSSVLTPVRNANVTASSPVLAALPVPISELSLKNCQGSDEEYYVGIAPVSSSAPLLNLHWRLVTAVPKRDFLDEISKGRSLAIGLAGVVAVCSSLVCTLLLWRLLLPLGRIAHEMTQAATLRDQDIQLQASTSWLRDIFAIEDAFATLILQLTVARSFLPSSLIAQLNAESLSSNFANTTIGEVMGVAHRKRRASNNSRRRGPRWMTSGDDDVTSEMDEYGLGGDDDDDEDEGPIRLDGRSPGGGGRYSGVYSPVTNDGGGSSLVLPTTGTSSLAGAHGTGYRPQVVSTSIVPFAESRNLSLDGGSCSGGSDTEGRGGGVAAANKTGIQHSKGTTRNKEESLLTRHEAPMSIHLHARTRTVSVVATNLCGFHRAVRGKPALLGNSYAKWVDFVSSTAAQHKGVLDSFQGDHCVITFNAAIACGPHASAAVTVAGTLAQHTSLTLQAGVSSGSAFVGNFGSTRSRRFGQIGTAVPNAVLLARLVRLLPPEAKASVVMGRAVAEDTEHVAQSLYFDVLEVASESQQQQQQQPNRCGSPSINHVDMSGSGFIPPPLDSVHRAAPAAPTATTAPPATAKSSSKTHSNLRPANTMMMQPLAVLYALRNPSPAPPPQVGGGHTAHRTSPGQNGHQRREEWMYELAASEQATSIEDVLIDRLNALFKKVLHARLRHSGRDNGTSVGDDGSGVSPSRAKRERRGSHHDDCPPSPLPPLPQHQPHPHQVELAHIWKAIHGATDRSSNREVSEASGAAPGAMMVSTTKDSIIDSNSKNTHCDAKSGVVTQDDTPPPPPTFVPASSIPTAMGHSPCQDGGSNGPCISSSDTVFDSKAPQEGMTGLHVPQDFEEAEEEEGGAAHKGKSEDVVVGADNQDHEEACEEDSSSAMAPLAFEDFSTAPSSSPQCHEQEEPAQYPPQDTSTRISTATPTLQAHPSYSNSTYSPTETTVTAVLSVQSRLRPLAVQTATCIARLVSGGPVTMPLGLFFDQCLMPLPSTQISTGGATDGSNSAPEVDSFLL